jgi:hypothetical protein
MDVQKTLRELYEEKRRLDLAIASLEARLQVGKRNPAGKRRGRKSMSDEERRQVSLRMMKYWEDRRAQSKPGDDDSKLATGTERE